MAKYAYVNSGFVETCRPKLGLGEALAAAREVKA